MMASYIQRTSLSSEGLRHGDVSLRLRNVTLEDNGKFRCFIPNLKIDAEVLLLVDPNFVSTTPSEPPENRNLITPDPQDELDGTGESAGGKQTSS
ncbi:putative selection and upkeep of intraepithelial T-cells protein 1 homolog, partial [Austrofundulus limnaeus]|uniref:Selection and upkeep of intraepithelial T-cells protein 1 homolog n=1 Tax=Austrofundulus limnaeus TaxID=52670 RepID=A0A2I4AL43_AUSLI